MARQLLRGDRLRAAREPADLTREDLAVKLESVNPARIRVWERGLARPRPRVAPQLATALDVEPLHLLDVEPDDPPLAALRVAAGLATNEMGTPGVSVMTYVRLEDGRPSASATVDVVDAGPASWVWTPPGW